MIWVKSALVGVLFLFGCVLVSVFAFPVILSLKGRREVGWDPTQIIRSPLVLVVLAVMFMAGFCWEYHRLVSR